MLAMIRICMLVRVVLLRLAPTAKSVCVGTTLGGGGSTHTPTRASSELTALADLPVFWNAVACSKLNRCLVLALSLSLSLSPGIGDPAILAAI